jgi:multidrug efflux pump
MLVGLAAKNGILIVEFANQRRDEGLAIADAVVDAAATRLRPILMTSIATVTGALPLVLASGAGSASREAIGVVVVAGVLLSTFLSLFVIPAFYLLLARGTRAPEERGRELDALEREVRSVDAAKAH